MPGFDKWAPLLKKLGKHKTGKSCLYVNHLEDVDLEMLEKLIKDSFEEMRRKQNEQLLAAVLRLLVRMLTWLPTTRDVLADGDVAGRRILIMGGAGRVGHYAIQWASQAGASVVASASNDDDAAACKEAGAEAVVDHRLSDVAEAVLDATDGEPVDRIVDVEFGEDVTLVEPVNLYGCTLGDGVFVGPFVEIQKRLQGWQLESFKDSYKNKLENGISLFKKQNQNK